MGEHRGRQARPASAQTAALKTPGLLLSLPPHPPSCKAPLSSGGGDQIMGPVESLQVGLEHNVFKALTSAVGEGHSQEVAAGWACLVAPLSTDHQRKDGTSVLLL